MPNRLSDEQSPYLRQHQDNPVDWYPWGEAAFAKARAEQKPIFLSIGYSTCHWCHVMAHESFEDAAMAEALNRDFVAVKVDREERPDVDRVYMTFVQATTGSGGWPMSVWLTPALEPFFGGTYFPPTSRWGRPGLLDVLTEIARAWREERERVVTSAGQLVGRLREIGGVVPGESVPGVDVLATAVQDFVTVFDARRGGFGGAPKFPRPSELLFLMREHARTGAPAPAAMALRTLQAMADGGLRDHLGGGFHRYSVDAEWRVPHFEKMLYDQAQLTLAYLEAATLTGEAAYAEVAADTLAYVARELTHPDGGFYSAEDADSLTSGTDADGAPHLREGAFYLWTMPEWNAVLGDDAGVAAARFGVEPGGNAPADPQGEFAGQNVLYLARSIDDVAAAAGRAPTEVAETLAHVKRALRQHRVTRPRPHRDDKVLTAWNGLMIAAAARAARMFADSDWCLDMAVRATDFVRRRLWDASSATLYRRFRDGHVAVEAYAEDYACLIFGLLELFQATADAQWLSWAIELQRQQDSLFWDEAGGGWFSTSGRDASVLLRLKEDYDGAEPAATSVGVFNLLTLVHLTADPTWTDRLPAALRVFGARAASNTRTVPMALAALSTYHAGLSQVVITGEEGDPTYEAMRDIVRTSYLPSAVVVMVPSSRRAGIEAVLPWVAALPGVGEGARAFVCRDFVCQTPCRDAHMLAEQLALVGGVSR